MPDRLFVFIQAELPFSLGVPDGRYLLRERSGGEPEHVLVVGSPNGAPPPRRRRWQRLRGRGSRRAWRGQRVELAAGAATDAQRSRHLDRPGLALGGAPSTGVARRARRRGSDRGRVRRSQSCALRPTNCGRGPERARPCARARHRDPSGVGPGRGGRGRALEPRARAALGRATIAGAGGGFAPAGALRGAARWPRATAHLRGARASRARRSRCRPHAPRGARARRVRTRPRSRSCPRSPTPPSRSVSRS